MAVPQRIKGQEVQILVVAGGVLVETIDSIMNFNVIPQSETKIQGYLGEMNNRTDDIFNQVKFDLELHLNRGAWFNFVKSVNDRQKRITPDVQFNISATLLFANGDTPTVLLNDCKFGEMPHNVGSRSDYVKVKLDGVCDDVAYQDVPALGTSSGI